MITTQMLLETTRNLHLLYVEDDNDLLSTTEEFFSLYFKSVTTAVNGEDALQKYIDYEKKNSEYFDIVITDISMPKLNGIDMSRKILKLNQTQAILIVTAHTSSQYLCELIEMGIDGYLVKPVNNEQLFKSMFRVTRSISDHKMIENYVKQVENLNLELHESNTTLQKRNEELEKSLRMLDTVIHKNGIITKQSEEENESDKSDEKLRLREDIKSQIIQLINDDLFELRELLDEIDVCIIDIINNSVSISDENLGLLIKHFSRYAAILNYYTFFNELSLAMANFSQVMKDTPLPENMEIRNNVFTFLETFIYVLTKWQDGLALGEENTLNQLDASIISDMDTIINMWLQVEEESSQEDLDDIFDF